MFLDFLCPQHPLCNQSVSNCRESPVPGRVHMGLGNWEQKAPESSLPGAWQANVSWRITVHTIFIFETIIVSHIRLWNKQISGSLVEGQWNPTISICFSVARCYLQMTDTWTHHVPRLFRKERPRLQHQWTKWVTGDPWSLTNVSNNYVGN